ncbi:hypothetical protein F0562_019945 [Nyssa sinensis]|uniref:Formin-like protein n=1 Tax=Nyssa sinensis TaxID=561372 RepID=A0A5J5BQB9_9ASTE|nr:hypothetical protein F0562_019945 [Nyssa sinensis]
MEGSGDGKENHIKRVSGEDENKEKEALILEKVRVLLGLKSFNIRSPSNGESEYGSPAVSPSPIEVEAPAPAPAPVLPIHVHSHRPPLRPSPIPQPYKIQKEDRYKGRTKRILIAVFVSTGATSVICVIGLIWFCQKFRKQRKRSASTVSIYSSEGGSRGRSKYVSSQNSVKKVSSDPVLNLFYLDSLGTVLEPQPLCVKHHSETANICSNQNISNCTLQEREESDRVPTKSESDYVDSASGEIRSLHESAESIKYDSDGCISSSGDKIIPVDAHSSDDESFHSLCDSHSSSRRLSNASAVSLSDTSEIIFLNMSNLSPCSVTSPMNLAIPSPTPASISTLASDLHTYPSQAPCNLEQNVQRSPSHSSSRWLSDASAGSFSDTSEIISLTVSNISTCSVNSPMNLAIPSPTPASISTLASDLHLYPFQAPCNLEQKVQRSPSHSSSRRLSNASVGSLSDTSEIISLNVSKLSPCSVTSPMNLAIPSPTPAAISPCNLEQNVQTSPYPPQAPCSLEQNVQASPCSSNCQKGSTFPPPPPPPLPSVHISPSYSSSCSIRISSKALNSSILPNLSSPRNSDFSSGSSQTPKSVLSSSPPNPPKPPMELQLPKLKPLHWDKVRAAPDRSMVWDKLRPSSFELDEEMIESLFGYNLQNSMTNDEAKSKTPSPSKHVLEPKRLQNITILSKALNATAEQICYALLQGNGLCLQQLEALVKMVPTKEEEDKLSSYKGDINELGSAEKFVKAMLNIPFAFSRIEAMLYRETFEDEVVHLRKSFSMLEEACKELRSSRLFLKLLEAVLKTGNRMNVGTIRGGARAFKLDALLKLADVKGIDGKTTLLHFVVQEIVRLEGIRASESIMGKINEKSKNKNVEEREEDYKRMGLDLVSSLSTELCNVKKTATIDLDVLASSVSNLSDGMAKLQHLVCKDLCMDEKSINFVHSIRSFLGYAEKNIKELQEDEDRVLLHVREITEYFHGDVIKEEANPLRIFVIVRDFLGMQVNRGVKGDCSSNCPNNNGCCDKSNPLRGYSSCRPGVEQSFKKAIKDLKQENPNALIVIADYYNTFKSLFHIAPYLGFDATSLHKASCGIGGKYNFNLTRMCGAPDVSVCPDPHRRFSWDGVHLTQEAYKLMAEKLIHELLPKLQCF